MIKEQVITEIEVEYLMQKILLLEDDLNLNRGIALLLSREGYERFVRFIQ